MTIDQSPRKIRVLHLASFHGNIGDVANHAGARALFRECLDFSFEISELEIREFYWGLRKFDTSFVELANRFDLLLIGGGNYFELWVDKSATGTSIDIEARHLRALSVPTIFYSLGVDTGQGYSQVAAQRFRAFMDSVLSRDEMFVCVRNDGSRDALATVLGDRYAQRIPVMPDGGFFAGDTVKDINARLPGDRTLIGVNLAGDMLEHRFSEGFTASSFLTEFAQTCVALMDEYPALDIELVPHIWRDVQVVSNFLPQMPDRLLRSRVRVAGLQASPSGLESFLSSYGNYSLVLGTRFHANVCPIGMGVPTRGLLNYPQVSKLYGELGMEDRLIDVRRSGFGESIYASVKADLENDEAIRVRYKTLAKQLRHDGNEVLSQMNLWLKRVIV